MSKSESKLTISSLSHFIIVMLEAWDAILKWICFFSNGMGRTLLQNGVNLSIKSWNNWNIFSPRLSPPYPSRRPHLSVQKVWRKRGGDWFRQCFPPKSYYFLHQQFSIPTFCTHILLSFSTHILSFAHTLTHNSCHFFFWKDNNWHHYLWKEKKDVY